MKENYPSFVFDKDSDITARDVAGKKFILIDDNSSTGRIFVGLRNFIEENGGRVIGYYALTTGHDQSEKMVTTDETWNEILSIGLEAIRDFAEKEGVRREVSKEGLSERESRELVKRFRNKEVDTGRGIKAGARSEGGKAKIRGVYEKNGSTGKSDKVNFSLKDEIASLSKEEQKAVTALGKGAKVVTDKNV